MSTPAINKNFQGSPSSSLLSEDLGGVSSGLHDLIDNIDLGFTIGDLLPVDEEFNLDLLLADAAPPALPAAIATGALAAAAEAEAAAVAGGQAQPMVSAANSINCNERVCCNAMDAECMCCQSSEQQQQRQQQDEAKLAPSSSPASAAADVAADNHDDACAATSIPATTATTAADCNDSNTCTPRTSHNDLVAEDLKEDVAAAPSAPNTQVAAAAAAATLEAEFAALQATDAAMYAMIVHQQMMQTRLLLTTTANALLLQRARSASLSSSQFSRRESFGEISPMVM